MNKKTDIDELLNGYCNNSLSSEDKIVLRQWIDAADSNKVKAIQYISTHRQGRELSYLYQYNSGLSWMKLQGLLKQRKKRRIFAWSTSVAATVLVVLAISVFKNSTQTKPVLPALQPGSSMAFIQLSDGQVIDVDSLMEGEVLKVDETLLRREGGQLVYVNDSTRKKASIYLNTLVVPRNGEHQVKLADGSVLWVNSESKVKYPTSFKGEDVRRIQLISGEIFIDVVRNSAQPFIVNSKGVDIKVLGTRFNVNAYDDELSVKVTLEEGSVRVYTNDKTTVNFEPVSIEPGQQLEIDYNKSKVFLREVDVQLYTAWVAGQYFFKDEEIKDIMRVLSRWYDCEVIYQNEKLKRKRYSGRVKKYENVELFLDILTRYNEFSYEVSGKKIYIKNP